MSTRFRLPTLSALALVLAAACESPNDPTFIRVYDATLEAAGDTTKLVAAVLYNKGQPVWESLHPEIVTVTSDGRAVAVGAGTATVRARVGSAVGEGKVTVMPPVEVQVISLTLSTDPTGQPRVTAQLRNVGGRGYYRIQHWQMRESPEGEHRRVLNELDDRDAPVGMDISTSWVGFPHQPDWVIVYSREPNSTQYRITGCLRADGGTPCPAP